MKPFCAIFFVFCAAGLFANNFEVTSHLYIAPSSGNQKSVNLILKEPGTKQLFTAKIIGHSGAASSCTLVNHFETQKAGFTFRTTPENAKTPRKTNKINFGIDWILPSEGPFRASGKESFYEGTVINGSRFLRPDTYSPLGINYSKDAKVVYIPAVQFSKFPEAPVSVFRRYDKWEVSIKIMEPGKSPQTIRTIPVYHRGRFPVTNPAGFKCRMYNYRGITVLNMYYSRQRGVRENGSPVMEEISLNLCFAAPEKGKEIRLADITSFCFAENAAFTKLPADGGKEIRYQVFLKVK